MAKIVWSELAKDHLKEIDSYISKGSPLFSMIFIEKLIHSVEKISLFPKVGRVVPEFADENLRETFFYNYRIVYFAKKEEIAIIAIVHGAMDISKRRENEDWKKDI